MIEFHNSQGGRKGIPDSVWKAARTRNRAEAIQEQNKAAGGEAARRIQLSDGSSRSASVELKRVNGHHRIYAYLRYSNQGRTISRYIGQVSQSSRFENLKQAWSLVHHQNLEANEGPGVADSTRAEFLDP
jgi:hypothetical protein